MFTRASTALLGQRLSGVPPATFLQRRFSVKAIYSAFPATLHYYSPHHISSLFDHKEDENRPDDLFCEAVNVAEDGLVYPGVQNNVSNGAVLRANTINMQQGIRMYYDWFYIDLEDEGRQVERPRIYTIRKETRVPSHIILMNEYSDKFSLQPSCGMSLSDWNRCLDEFRSENAQKTTADQWFDKHPYHEAMLEADDDVWMAE